MVSQPPYFIFGNEDSDFVKITYLRTIRENISDLEHLPTFYYAQIEIKSGNFYANYTADLELGDLQVFSKELDRIYNDPKGITRFFGDDQWIDIKLTGDGTGKYMVDCWAHDYAKMGTHLSCKMLIDQTYIPILKGQIEEVLQMFS